MKNKMKWLCAFLVFCLTAACMTACNSKGDFATAKAAIDRTLSLGTFQMDGTIDIWMSSGEFGLDPGEIGMENAGSKGKVEFSECLLSENTTNYYIQQSLITETPAWGQNDTKYWYEDGVLYIVEEPFKTIENETRGQEATKTKLELPLEHVLESFDMRQWIAQFDESQIIQGSLDEQEDGSLIYSATLKGDSLLPDILDERFTEKEHKDVEVSIKIKDHYATEMEFHYIFADEKNATDLNYDVHFTFTNLGTGVEIPERPQGEYEASSWNISGFGLF